MFIINNKSDYGLLLLEKLQDEKNRFVPLSKLVEKTKLPPRFISRIASELVKSGILQSKEGKVGGYKISKDLQKISLLTFIRIFNKDMEIVKCKRNRFVCSFDKICSHKFFLKDKLTKIFINELGKWKLADLIH